MFRSSSVSLLLLSTALSLSAAQQYEGDACTVDGKQGACSIVSQCPSVLSELLKGKPPKVLCSYQNYAPVICCPKTETTATSTTRTTTATRRTTTSTTVTAPVNREPNTVVSRIAKEKCEEYSKAVFEMKIPPILSVNPQPVNSSVCAIKFRKLIVGGEKAEPKEFPHMAAVGYTKPEGGISWSCGGTLISERFVLSAAHCVFSRSWGAATWVRVGDLNLEKSNDDAKPQEYRIIEKIRHPMYRTVDGTKRPQNKSPQQYHDIALFKLENNVQFNAWTRPSCLPYSSPDVGTEKTATATGWGHVEWAAESGSSDLLKVTISLISNDRCNNSFSDDPTLERGIVNEWQVCAGEVGKDTCQGDSGGPLVVFNKDYYCMYSVIGITSIGRVCGSIVPGVYTRVIHYVPWIASVVWPDS